MGTYLEDYLESIYMLPSEIKRNFDLMRDLDKTSYALIDDLKSNHSAFLINARKKVLHRLGECKDSHQEAQVTEEELRSLVESDEQLTKLKGRRQQVVQKLDEKYAIACQSYDIIDHHIRRLDADLEAYAELLRSMGEFEEDKVSASVALSSATGNAGSGSSSSAALASTSTVGSGSSSGLKKKKSSAFASASAQQQTVSTPVIKKTSTPMGGTSGSSTSGSGALASSSSSGTTSGRKRNATEAFDALTPSGTVSNASLGLAVAMPEDLQFDPNEPVYCLCRRISYGQMIGCDNDDCKYEWFHFDCVGLTEQPAGKWYCPDCQAHLKS